MDTKNNLNAVSIYENCLATNPNYTKALFNLSYLYIRKEGRAGIDKALKMLLKLKKIDMDYERLHYRLGTIYCELGEWDKGLESLERAYSIRKKDGEIPYIMGKVYFFIKKDYLKAFEYFAVSIQDKTPPEQVEEVKGYMQQIKKILHKTWPEKRDR